jgi:hypothetical protein
MVNNAQREMLQPVEVTDLGRNDKCMSPRMLPRLSRWTDLQGTSQHDDDMIHDLRRCNLYLSRTKSCSS